MIRVHIVCDQPLLRDAIGVSIAGEPNVRLVGMSATCRDILPASHPDVIVFCERWRELPDSTQEGRQKVPQAKIIAFGCAPDAAAEAGIDRVLDSRTPLDRLAAVIREVGG